MAHSFEDAVFTWFNLRPFPVFFLIRPFFSPYSLSTFYSDLLDIQHLLYPRNGFQEVFLDQGLSSTHKIYLTQNLSRDLIYHPNFPVSLLPCPDLEILNLILPPLPPLPTYLNRFQSLFPGCPKFPINLYSIPIPYSPLDGPKSPSVVGRLRPTILSLL